MTPQQIRFRIKRRWPSWDEVKQEESFRREIALRKAMNFKGICLTIFNVSLIITFLALMIMIIVCTFKANWPHVIGYVIINLMVFVIFQITPNARFPDDELRLLIDLKGSIGD